ncbi:hypothetical protein RHSIM_RhsimUnG0013500 [Rhododendron simsii]|uniref:Uncharacterized protein n=1 Tax=Rhododendron simsii TaxID=118357 RepID=A0A834G014_RHOSS|nr:hypothetical protein RHSIM_RhsimUnG0013500 [Rhododendron simsii]
MDKAMTAVVVVPFLVAVISAAAIAGCPLLQGTDGFDEVLIPDNQSSIPSDVQTTRSSVTGDGATLGDVDTDGEDDDPCGCYGDHQFTAAGICPNDYVAGFPPHHVDFQIDACPCPCPALTMEITTEIRTEEWVEEDVDDVDDDKFGNSLVGLTFEDAVALMVSSFQPRVDLSSFLNTMARVAIVFDLTVSLIGWMLLRIGHPRAANYFRSVGRGRCSGARVRLFPRLWIKPDSGRRPAGGCCGLIIRVREAEELPERRTLRIPVGWVGSGASKTMTEASS